MKRALAVVLLGIMPALAVGVAACMWCHQQRWLLRGYEYLAATAAVAAALLLLAV
jgi:hypothetical protein